MAFCCFGQKDREERIHPLASQDEIPSIALMDIVELKSRCRRLQIIYNHFAKLRALECIRNNYSFRQCTPSRSQAKQERIRREVQVLSQMRSREASRGHLQPPN